MEQAAAKGKVERISGTSTDDELRYATNLDPNLEQWRSWGAEFVQSRRFSKNAVMMMMKILLVDYIHGQQLETNPAIFFRAGYRAPCLYETCLKKYKTKKVIVERYNIAIRFINYVLMKYFSVQDDYGNPILPPEFRNPIPALPAAVNGHRGPLQESDKSVLPYHLITRLRNQLCPTNAVAFADWKWAQIAEDVSGRKCGGGGWFVVPFDLIDESDPDCVWRTRKTTRWERKKWRCGDFLHEMWSPVRAVALYVKLHLPLRTFQVRMIDSGEADTQRYEVIESGWSEPDDLGRCERIVKGRWVRNSGDLAKGTEKNCYRRGIFRQMSDDLCRTTMTGLYINTNKTADLGKDDWCKGYSIPWEHPEALFWCEKLAIWQAKYNPISAPTSWTELKRKHLGNLMAKSRLKAMGVTCFLFRDAAAPQPRDKSKPVADGLLETVWHKLLQNLENQCARDNRRDAAGNPLVFVKPGIGGVTYYPLHCLRVSLITAYALEGGVPIGVLSKCIAGHSRLLMTIYYVKAGITFCTETMDAATKLLMVTEQQNYAQWLKDKTYEQLEANGAFNDPAAIQAIMRAMQNGASLIMDDKGFCPKGGWGCDSGGVYINEDTGKVTYGEVPGYPQKNCPRCRWFFTSGPFLDGLHNHWNYIQLLMSDVGERVVKLEAQVTSLEDEQFECQANDRPFLNADELAKHRKIYQSEYEKNNKLALDLSATHRLIARCMSVLRVQQVSDAIQLVGVGDHDNVQIAINECGKLQQLLTAVAGSVVYPEHDVSKAALRAGKAFDTMLESNGRKPVFFRLDEDELLLVSQKMTKLLAARAGSIKDAVPFIEGTRLLNEIGIIDLDLEDLKRDMAAGSVIKIAPLQVLNNPIVAQPLLAASACAPEVSNAGK